MKNAEAKRHAQPPRHAQATRCFACAQVPAQMARRYAPVLLASLSPC